MLAEPAAAPGPAAIEPPPAPRLDTLPAVAVSQSNGSIHGQKTKPAGAAGTFDAASQPFEITPVSLPDRILASLDRSPTPVDELIRECHVSPALVSAALLDLELSGRVERLQGNLVVLI
jgi:predicted Rossmann fold nucleotide-binding protein DprA/Smf involved in DNA uptake